MISNLLSPCSRNSEGYVTNEFEIVVDPISKDLPPMCWSDGVTEVYLTASESAEGEVAVMATVRVENHITEPADYIDMAYDKSLSPEEALQVAEKAIKLAIKEDEDHIGYSTTSIISGLKSIGFIE